MRIIDLIKTNWEKLLAGMDEAKRERYGLVLHRLMESLQGLKIRATDLVNVESKITSGGDVSHDLQVEYLNRVEGYHQQVYSTLSNLIMVANFYGIRGKKLGHPFSSVQSFLHFMKDKCEYGNSRDKEHYAKMINTLERSVIFRSQQVDHPQQNKTQHWMTYDWNGKGYIIYYVPKSRNVYARGLAESDPDTPMFRPSVDCESFSVSPREDLTQQAIIDFTAYILDL